MYSDKQGSIQGCFGKKKIYYKLLYGKKPSKNYFIFFHGSYSSSISNNKDAYISEYIIRKNLGNVLLYETSRQLYSFETHLSFQEYKLKFGRKTFQEEREDIQRLFTFFRTSLVHTSAPHINFIGFSLGGTLMSYLLPTDKNHIKNIFLFGSGVTTKVKGSTYSGYPKEDEILKNFKMYKGNVFLVRGAEDEVIDEADMFKIYKASMNAHSVQITKLQGIDHSFRKIHGKEAVARVAHKLAFYIATSVN